jgi:hypothetical protein
MNDGIVTAVLVTVYLVVVLSGWGVCGYSYYRFIMHDSTSKSLNRALASWLLGVLIGHGLKSAYANDNRTTVDHLFRFVATAWWIIPYVLAAAFFVAHWRANRQQQKGQPNQAL